MNARTLAILLTQSMLVPLVHAAPPGAQEPPTQPCSAVSAADRSLEQWFDPAGIRGTLVLAGRGRLPSAIVDTFRSATRESQSLVVVGAASADGSGPERVARTAERWRERGLANVATIVLENQEQANAAENVEAIRKAGAVWLTGRDGAALAEMLGNSALARELAALLERGGLLGAANSCSAVVGQYRVASNADAFTTVAGAGLLPDVVVLAGRSNEHRSTCWQAASAEYPTMVGVEIASRTALVLSGRQIRVQGEGVARFHLAAHREHAAEVHEIATGRGIDYTALRRAARQRAENPFPAPNLRPPVVPCGSLVIVGGGGLPPAIMERFIELAGGPEAPIVVLPTALPDPVRVDDGVVALMRRAGAQNIQVLDARTKAEVESEGFAAALQAARGVWFGGGRQWRFVDAYAHTRAERMLHEVLARGGVIGGSSAGASIQAEYLVRGNPLGNEDMMALGYEQGLGFLPGTAVDQHFSQRNRFDDLRSVVLRYPQLLGIGIDEATALVVQGSTGAVLGRGAVHFCVSVPGDPSGTAEYHKVPAGESYDLQQRQSVNGAPEVNVK